jgi:hypothetical protein
MVFIVATTLPIHYSGEKLKGIISRTSIASFASGKEVFVQDYGSCDSPDIVIARAEEQVRANRGTTFSTTTANTLLRGARPEESVVNR